MDKRKIMLLAGIAATGTIIGYLLTRRRRGSLADLGAADPTELAKRRAWLNMPTLSEAVTDTKHSACVKALHPFMSHNKNYRARLLCHWGINKTDDLKKVASGFNRVLDDYHTVYSAGTTDGYDYSDESYAHFVRNTCSSETACPSDMKRFAKMFGMKVSPAEMCQAATTAHASGTDLCEWHLKDRAKIVSTASAVSGVLGGPSRKKFWKKMKPSLSEKEICKVFFDSLGDGDYSGLQNHPDVCRFVSLAVHSGTDSVRNIAKLYAKKDWPKLHDYVNALYLQEIDKVAGKMSPAELLTSGHAKLTKAVNYNVIAHTIRNLGVGLDTLEKRPDEMRTRVLKKHIKDLKNYEVVTRLGEIVSTAEPDENFTEALDSVYKLDQLKAIVDDTDIAPSSGDDDAQGSYTYPVGTPAARRQENRFAQENPKWAIKRYQENYDLGKGAADILGPVLNFLARQHKHGKKSIVLHGRDGEIIHQLLIRMGVPSSYILTPRTLTDASKYGGEKLTPKQRNAYMGYLKRVCPTTPSIHVDTGFSGAIALWLKAKGIRVDGVWLVSSEHPEFQIPDVCGIAELRDRVINELEHRPQRLLRPSVWGEPGKISYGRYPGAFWARMYGAADALKLPRKAEDRLTKMSYVKVKPTKTFSKKQLLTKMSTLFDKYDYDSGNYASEDFEPVLKELKKHKISHYGSLITSDWRTLLSENAVAVIEDVLEDANRDDVADTWSAGSNVVVPEWSKIARKHHIPIKHKAKRPSSVPSQTEQQLLDISETEGVIKSDQDNSDD